MTIFFALILVLVYSIMCLSVQDTNEKPNGISCNIDQRFHSKYVTPVIEQVTDAKGCLSKETGTEAQEVHVLSLLSSGSDDPIGSRNGYLPSVSLNVRPRWKQRDPPHVTVVILHSPLPVKWQINFHHLRNSTSFHIVVNKPSYVVPSISAHVSRQKLPSIKRLPSWVKSHHGAVTSFSSISLANKITLYPGTDFKAAAVCNTSTQVQSPNIKASYVQLQSATGCSVNNSQNYEKKHSIMYVIELNSSIKNSDVFVHLQQYTDGESLEKVAVQQNLILILKCHNPVDWIIKSSGIEGSLFVVAEYPVHIRTNPFDISARVQETVLPNDSAALLQSVQTSFGFIDTYMKTGRANKINVLVKGKNRLLLNSKSSDDWLSFDSVLTNQETFAGSDFIYTINKIKSALSDSKSESLTDQSLSYRLMDHIMLECSADRMSIAFPFDATMEVLTSALGSNSKLSSVTLVDSNCKAKHNETLIVLKTSWNNCGTKVVSSGGRITYHNQVQFITTKYQPSKDFSNDRKHLLTDDDDYISEDGSGSQDVTFGHQKYNKDEQIIYPLPVFCSQLVTDKSTGLSIEKFEFQSEKFELNIYTKKDFRQINLQKSFPLTVVVHDHLFAEAVIKADPRLCINVDECWLSENDGFKNEEKKSTLIKQGCPTDLSVEILSKSHCGNQADVDHYKMKFSFQLSEDFINQNLYLHCRFTSCAMKDSAQLNVKQCIENENFCIKPNLRPYLEPVRGKKYSLLVQGPFYVISKTKIDKGKDLLSFPKPVTTSSPDNFVVDYSFDKLTGNNKKNPVSQQLVFIGLSTEAVVGIAFASFIIGAGLMATLWLIHMHTEPTRRFKQNRKPSVKQYQNESQLNYDRTESAESSGPSSLRPMSVHICS